MIWLLFLSVGCVPTWCAWRERRKRTLRARQAKRLVASMKKMSASMNSMSVVTASAMKSFESMHRAILEHEHREKAHQAQDRASFGHILNS